MGRVRVKVRGEGNKCRQLVKRKREVSFFSFFPFLLSRYDVLSRRPSQVFLFHYIIWIYTTGIFLIKYVIYSGRRYMVEKAGFYRAHCPWRQVYNKLVPLDIMEMEHRYDNHILTFYKPRTNACSSITEHKIKHYIQNNII